MIGAAIVCGPRRRCQRVITATCDHDGCSARVLMATRAEYVAAAELGWRRQQRMARCPEHAADFAAAAAS